MCGIYGYAGFDEPGLMERMGAALRHRGPDGEGRYERGGFQMGMRRLSILDLEGGAQPIYNEDRTLAVCYNGEIYNYVELAEELRGKGHHFQTGTDTEVIVHAYEEWGIDCLKRFNGMYAFSLHDAQKNEVVFGRDRCGQKPFYYWREGGRLVFASEVKAIVESARVSREVNLDAVDAYLALRYVPEPATMFRGIYTLPAAHWMRVKLAGGVPGEPEIRRYWDITLAEGGNYRSDEEYLEELEEGFFRAVEIAMRSDVPVGAYLSAGVDSALCVAAMRKFSDKVNTFSIGFRSPVDETKDAAETARLLGTRHTEIHCTPEDFVRLPKVVYQMDRPVGDALILAFDRLAAAAGRDYKVVMSGEGADEMYAGYSFHKVMQLVHNYRRYVPGWAHGLAAVPALKMMPVGLLNRFFKFPAYLGREGKARVVDFMAGFDRRNLSENYVLLKTLWSLEERRSIYSEGFRSRATDAWMPKVRDGGGVYLDRLLKLQYDDWVQDWCVIRQDKNTMAHSLEVRLPFLDHNLIEMAFRMPPHLKAKGAKDKIIERRLAAKLLPPEVANRAKNPFFMPMEFFFEHPEISQWIDLTLNEEQVRRRGYFDPAKVRALRARMESREFVTVKQVMSLVILELWHMIFIDKQQLW